MKNRPLHVRMGFALNGLRHCWRSEKSFRTQSVAAVVLLVALIAIQPAAIWWAILLLTSATILAFEVLNSALERLIDHIHPAIHPDIGLVKDMAAGAVLLLSGAALMIGVCLIAASL
ncbi:diacylglycerol kinase [Sphingobium sp. CAP-1]|nr:diacylglycerol kinase [Sphingobium sp. CAP-1]